MKFYNNHKKNQFNLTSKRTADIAMYTGTQPAGTKFKAKFEFKYKATEVDDRDEEE